MQDGGGWVSEVYGWVWVCAAVRGRRGGDMEKLHRWALGKKEGVLEVFPGEGEVVCMLGGKGV